MGRLFVTTVIAFSLLVMAPAVSAADSVTGQLLVVTTIPVACGTPSPSGNLDLPLSVTGDLATGQGVSSEVSVTIACTGNPVIESVTFGDGLYAEDRSSRTKKIDKFRAMKRTSVSDDGTKTNYLGYKLYASKRSGFTAQDSPGNLMKTIAEDPSEGTLTLGDRGTATFYLKAKIYEKDATRAYKKAAEIAAGGQTDVLIMTITYN